MGRDFRPRARGGFRNTASLLTPGLRRGVALVAAASLLSLSGRGVAAAAPNAPSGQVTVAAGLKLDGSPAVAGQTVFPGSTLDAAERTRPALALGNLARLELSGGATLRLDFSASTVGGSLEAGGARVYAPRGVAASVATADASVASDAEAGPALFSVQVTEEGTTLYVQTGRVSMRAGGRERAAEAGQTLRSAHGSAPEPAPRQGQNLSGKRKAGLFVALAAGLTAVVLLVALRGDEVEEEDFGGCVITLSPTDFPQPCF